MNQDRNKAIEQAVLSLSSGQGETFVHKQLVEAGYTTDEAEAILQEALKRIREQRDRDKNEEKNIIKIIGLVLLLSGLGILIYSFLSAKAGGFYVVPAGLIGFGIYTMLTGKS